MWSSPRFWLSSCWPREPIQKSMQASFSCLELGTRTRLGDKICTTRTRSGDRPHQLCSGFLFKIMSFLDWQQKQKTLLTSCCTKGNLSPDRDLAGLFLKIERDIRDQMCINSEVINKQNWLKLKKLLVFLCGVVSILGSLFPDKVQNHRPSPHVL